ncbi:MAG: peptidoglycan D,D-transpeptidase FtsI family protein [Clostridium chrysemydis]|uniref:peptidoglycan D,D-transpeptidase FtsI family protein n=1 Tax=Clostridium chrysemydis TaxID=2665504 RepID=UPI003F39A30C
MIVNKPKKKRKPMSRYSILYGVMILIFSAIAFRLVYLQVYKNDYYTDRANETATKFMAEKAPRGEILDSKGNVLATNREIYTLTYTQTKESEAVFYDTMTKVINILKDSKDELQDDCILKLDDKGKFYFAYQNSSQDNQQFEKIRFLRDRGLNEPIEREMYPKKSSGDFTEDETAKVNAELLKMTPEDVFYQLVKNYDLIALVDKDYNAEGEKGKEAKAKYKDMSGKDITNLILQKYSLEELRSYMVIKDAIKIQSIKGSKSVTIANNIDKDTSFIVYQKLNELPGIDVAMQPVRYYPYEKLGSAVLGYVSPIDSSLKDSYELRGYDASTDLIGKSGIEASFEDELRGVKGGKTVKVNSKGKVTEELFKLQSYPGNDVHLTINKDVQYAMQESLKDTINTIRESGTDNKGQRYPNSTRGGALAIDVNTGAILGMASYPDFDPNLFAIPGQLTKQETEQYFAPDLEKFGKDLIKRTGLEGKKTVDDLFPKDPNTGFRQDKYDLYPKPFYNYATLGLVPPGSIFKPLTTIAGLQEGVVKPGETINATGIFNIHPETFGKGFAPICWIYENGHGSHGPTDAEKALEVSCNFYMYETAYRLYKKEGGDINALNSIAKYAWKFGLGHDPNSKGNPSTGIEIEENTLGQTYNFDTMKQTIINSFTYDLNDILSSGKYGEGAPIYFVPFDYAYNVNDTENIETQKNQLKEKIKNRLEIIGTGKKESSRDEFRAEITPYVKNIMENSEVYKENVKKYEKDNNKKVDFDEQVKLVSDVIAQFTLSKKADMTSPAQLVYAAIGQGINQFTPLQLGTYIATLANGGTRYKLHLVDSVTDPEGNVVKKFDPEVLEKLNLDPQNVAAVKKGMERANQQDQGTAFSTFGKFPIPTAGKTGTADFSNNQRDYGRSPFATYVSFAPADKPQIAFVGVIYDGGHGGFTAPVAKATFEAYFKDELLKNHKAYTESSGSFKKYVKNAPKDNSEASIKKEQEDEANSKKDKKKKEDKKDDFNPVKDLINGTNTGGED